MFSPHPCGGGSEPGAKATGEYFDFLWQLDKKIGVKKYGVLLPNTPHL
jgi:hypothetical protein